MRLGWAWIWLALPAATSTEGMQATLVCRPEAQPGRVLCELTCVPAQGARLVWTDALVTETPEFLQPLRARVTPERFQATASREQKLRLAFVASKHGVGQVTVRARGVTCRGEGRAERCRPETHDVRAEVRVGS